MEPPGKIYDFYNKILEFYNLGINCAILHQEYLKMRVKKVNIFKDIQLENFNSIENFFFDLLKFNISFMP